MDTPGFFKKAAAVLALAGALLAAPQPALAGDPAKECTYVIFDYTPATRQPVRARYAEVVVRKSTPGSYFCCNGFYGGGYMGVQELASPYRDGSPQRVIIFSVWDNVRQGDDPDAIPERDRAKLIQRGDNVRTNRFGNENTGGQSFMPYDWKEGETIRTLVVEKPDGRGFRQVAGYVHLQGSWRLLSCWRTVDAGKGLDDGYAFVEDFMRTGESRFRERGATFGPVFEWDGSKWAGVPSFRFRKDNNTNTNINCQWDSQRNSLRLSTGGSISISQPYVLNKTYDVRPGAVSLPSGTAELVKAPKLETSVSEGKGTYVHGGRIDWAQDGVAYYHLRGVDVYFDGGDSCNWVKFKYYFDPQTAVFRNSFSNTYVISREAGGFTGHTRLVKYNDGTLYIDNANYHDGGTELRNGWVVTDNRKALGNGHVSLKEGAAIRIASALDIQSLSLDGGFLALAPGILTIGKGLEINRKTGIRLTTPVGKGRYTLLRARSVSGSLDDLQFHNVRGTAKCRFQNGELILIVE